MRLKAVVILCVLFLFTGCKNANGPLDKAILLRSKILESNGCSFRATVTADYGEKLYVFTMDCVADKEGNLQFSVVSPETISGITGKISTDGGALTFDDKMLAFPTMADNQITPIAAPWVCVKALRSGYINSCAENTNGYQISVDDSYAENAFRLQVAVKDNLPVFCEIFWEGSCVLTVSVEEFIYL